MAREIQRLTDRSVKANIKKAVKANKKVTVYYSDGGGLYQQVTATGASSWVFKYKLNGGKRREMGLGSYQTVSLSEAREEARKAGKLLKGKKDPIDEKEAAKCQKRVEESRSVIFRKAAQAHIETKKKGWKNAKHLQQWENTLETYVYPVIGDLPVDKIGVTDVRTILKSIWEDIPNSTSKIRGRIQAVIRAARSDDESLWANPALWDRHKDHFGKSPKVRHHPALPYQEVAAFMPRLRAKQGITARALEVTILTALRTNEVIGATFDEFDFAAKVWSVPPERMKGREEGDAQFRVPLCDRVIAIVKELAATKVSKFVFPGRKPDEPLSEGAMLIMLKGMRPGITVHGFRSTFRDWAEEQAKTPDHDPSGTCGSVREYALSHLPKDNVKKAYLRADLLENRRPLMEMWAEYCGGHIEAMPSKKAA